MNSGMTTSAVVKEMTKTRQSNAKRHEQSRPVELGGLDFCHGTHARTLASSKGTKKKETRSNPFLPALPPYPRHSPSLALPAHSLAVMYSLFHSHLSTRRALYLARLLHKRLLVDLIQFRIPNSRAAVARVEFVDAVCWMSDN